MAATRRLAGLIGHPVSHSISPRFQQAAFDALGIAARYERWDTAPEALTGRVAELRAPRFLGANVTMPHKEQVSTLIDDVELSARRAGAVNTIVSRDGRLTGSNTDISGFRRALREVGGFVAAGKRAIVLGAGGAARAIVLALEDEGAVAVMIANRHRERAQRLVNELRSDGGPVLCQIDWHRAVSPDSLRGADLLVNCTMLGLAGSACADTSPLEDGSLPPALFVCDVVANPLETPLLRQAREAGASSLGGLAMLVYQGAASFEQWTGQEAPIETMMRAAISAMSGMAGAGK